MRGSLVVLALAIAPFAAGSATAQATNPSSSSMRPMCEKDPGNPSAAGEANRTKKCPPPPPVATGKVTISGIVFFDLPPYDGVFDASNENGIAGWNVVLTGPAGQVTYNTATDPNNPGAYVFAGLPSGATYTVCVVPAMGWTQTSPTGGAQCPNGVGYSITVPPLVVDMAISDQNFGFYSN